MDRLDGLNWLQEQRSVRMLPISRHRRESIALRYWLAREAGDTHAEAKEFAVVGLSPVVLMLLSVALQVLWYYLKKWWDSRGRH